MSKLSIFKNKVNSKAFGPKLCNVIYQFCTNPKCKPTSFDELQVIGYCTATRSNHGMLCDRYGEVSDECDEHNIVVVRNPKHKWFVYLVFPAVDVRNDIHSYAFSSGDYCYCDTRDGYEEDDVIISNDSGDELCVEITNFSDGAPISGSKIFPSNYIEFSKLCLSYVNATRKPSLNEMIDEFNEQFK